MELHKLTIGDIKGYDNAKLSEVEKEIRHELAMIGMDIYSAQGHETAKKRGLKKNLARVLTTKGDMSAKNSK